MAHYFNNKTIWITGASAGIGRAVAIALSNYNTQLILSARNEQKLQETASACKHQNTMIAAGDLSNKESNSTIAERIAAEHTHIDIALLNAGTCEYIDVRNFDSSIFERVMQTNYMSMVYGIEACLPLLRNSSQPHLVGMSSTAAYIGMPRSEAYGASKASISHMLDALRISLIPENIAVSCISPGFVKTPLTDKNDFPMPGRISAEKAAGYIMNGIARQHTEIHFPKRFSYVLKLFALFPSCIQIHLLKHMLKGASS